MKSTYLHSFLDIFLYPAQEPVVPVVLLCGFHISFIELIFIPYFLFLTHNVIIMQHIIFLALLGAMLILPHFIHCWHCWASLPAHQLSYMDIIHGQAWQNLSANHAAQQTHSLMWTDLYGMIMTSQ